MTRPGSHVGGKLPPTVVHANLASARIVLPTLMVAAARPKPELCSKPARSAEAPLESFRRGRRRRATSEGCALRLRDGGEGLGDCGRERRRWSADQGRELATVVE